MSLRGAHRVPISTQVALLNSGVMACQGTTALLTAKWLGASDRGVIAVGQATSMVLVLAGGLGLVQGTRVLLADPSRQLTLCTYIRASRWLVLLQAATALTFGALAFAKLASVHETVLIGLFVVNATVGFRSALSREALHGIGWHRSAIGGELVASAMPLAACAVLQVVGRLTLTAAFAAIAIGVCAQWLAQSWSIRQAYRHEPARSVVSDTKSLVVLKRMVMFSLPGLTAGVGMAFAGRIDRLLLAYFDDTVAVGVYTTASTLADLPWVIPLSVSAIIVRSVAQSQSPGVHRAWWFRVMGGTLALAAFTLAGGWWLLDRFLGRDFSTMTPVLAILLVGSLALASLQVDLAVCAGLGDLRASAQSATWGVGIGLVAYFVLIPPYGATGCAVGSVITYVSMAVVARVRLQRHTELAKANT